MESSDLIRIVAGIGFVTVLMFLIQRRRKQVR